MYSHSSRSVGRCVQPFRKKCNEKFSFLFGAFLECPMVRFVFPPQTRHPKVGYKKDWRSIELLVLAREFFEISGYPLKMGT